MILPGLDARQLRKKQRAQKYSHHAQLLLMDLPTVLFKGVELEARRGH